jgi:hypothetical protein
MNQTTAPIRRFVLACAAAILTLAAPGYGSEYQQNEEIAPESAEDASVGLETMDKPPPRRPRLGLLINLLADRSPFWRDASLDLGLRAYDFRRENDNDTIAEANALGTDLAFQSGKWRDRLSITASWHTSNKIDAPQGSGGTGLLGPNQSDLSVISRAYLDADLTKSTAVRLYRQDFGMPYINRQDSRMIPNTFEAYVVRHPGERFQWIAGQITKMKKRDSEDFVPMAEIAGVAGDDSGTTFAGVRYTFENDTTIGTLVQHTGDLFTTAYSELSYKRTIDENWGMQGTAQVTNQWSTGSELLGDFSTYSSGMRGALSYRGAVLTAAYTKTGDYEIQKPFGGTPGFTSSMLFDFDRAKEEAFRIGLSQNFSKYGFPGASLIVNYTKGRNAATDLGAPLVDEDEIDVTVDFRPPEGLLKGLWLRIRYAEVDRGSPAADRRDVRIILNYSIGALQER